MEFTTKETGIKVVINPAGLSDANRLKVKILNSFKENNLNFNEELSKGNIFSLIMAMDSSQEGFEEMFVCLAKSTYGGVRITKEVFDKEDARADLYEVFYNCLKVNVYPFFKGLSSMLNTMFTEKRD